MAALNSKNTSSAQLVALNGKNVKRAIGILHYYEIHNVQPSSDGSVCGLFDPEMQQIQFSQCTEKRMRKKYATIPDKKEVEGALNILKWTSIYLQKNPRLALKLKIHVKCNSLQEQCRLSNYISICCSCVKGIFPYRGETSCFPFGGFPEEVILYIAEFWSESCVVKLYEEYKKDEE